MGSSHKRSHARKPGRFRKFLLRPWVRVVVIVVGCLVTSLVLATIVMASWVQTDAGKREVARRIEAFVSDQIAGSMRIGTLEEIGPASMRMRNVRFFAPGGSEVIHLREMETQVSMTALLGGRIVVRRGWVRGGHIRFGMNPRGGIGMDLAFRTPGITEDPSAPADRPLDVDNIVGTDLELTVDVHDSPRIHAQGLRCVMKAWAPRLGAKVQMRMRQLSGAMNIGTPIPIDFNVRNGRMRFDPERRDRTRLDLHGVLEDTPARLEIDLGTRDAHPHSDVRLSVPNTGAAIRESPSILQLMLGDLFSGQLDFELVVGD